MCVRNELAEHCAQRAFGHPEYINRQAETHIPDETDRPTGLCPRLGDGILRIGEDKIAERLLQHRPVRDAAADAGGIEHMAEIHREDREHDQPRRDMLAEDTVLTLNELLERATELFSTPAERAASAQGPSVKDLQAKIGEVTMEKDFLERALERVHGPSARR